MIFINRIKNPMVREVADWIFHIVVAALVALIITNLLLQRSIVNRISMLPTLRDGDNLIIEKVSVWLGNIERGDIITIKREKSSKKKDSHVIIKRVIAVEGDTVEIKNDKVFLNGQVLNENYTNGDTTENYGNNSELIVNEGYVYVILALILIHEGNILHNVCLTDTTMWSLGKDSYGQKRKRILFL